MVICDARYLIVCRRALLECWETLRLSLNNPSPVVHVIDQLIYNVAIYVPAFLVQRLAHRHACARVLGR
eukprot:m.893444 g.893444  ORF g.893444 m.893444 type:complete len:69 (+) comp23660_c1_seq1:763-969(+)